MLLKNVKLYLFICLCGERDPAMRVGYYRYDGELKENQRGKKL